MLNLGQFGGGEEEDWVHTTARHKRQLSDTKVLDHNP